MNNNVRSVRQDGLTFIQDGVVNPAFLQLDFNTGDFIGDNIFEAVLHLRGQLEILHYQVLFILTEKIDNG